MRFCSLTLLAVTLLCMKCVQSSAQNLPLPALDYEYDALEPYIDEATMKVHHLKHHEAYRTNLNAALQALRDNPETKQLAKHGVDVILTKLDQVPNNLRDKIRNHGGGYVNHALFWKLLKPQTSKDDVQMPQPSGDLAKAIEKVFGSFEDFQKAFSSTALSHFGSGWAWLYYDSHSGHLGITTTSNQDTPAMDSHNHPVLGLDVWEHAYYLKHQNRRADYIKDWWYVVNWEYASALYASAVSKGHSRGTEL